MSSTFKLKHCQLSWLIFSSQSLVTCLFNIIIFILVSCDKKTKKKTTQNKTKNWNPRKYESKLMDDCCWFGSIVLLFNCFFSSLTRNFQNSCAELKILVDSINFYEKERERALVLIKLDSFCSSNNLQTPIHKKIRRNSHKLYVWLINRKWEEHVCRWAVKSTQRKGISFFSFLFVFLIPKLYA